MQKIHFSAPEMIFCFKFKVISGLECSQKLNYKPSTFACNILCKTKKSMQYHVYYYHNSGKVASLSTTMTVNNYYAIAQP